MLRFGSDYGRLYPRTPEQLMPPVRIAGAGCLCAHLWQSTSCNRPEI